MLRRFFIWRAERRMARPSYRFDKRHYRGVFRPGFFVHLSQTKFWQTGNDPFQRSRKRRKRILYIAALIFVIALAWVVVESSRALALF